MKSGDGFELESLSLKSRHRHCGKAQAGQAIVVKDDGRIQNAISLFPVFCSILFDAKEERPRRARCALCYSIDRRRGGRIVANAEDRHRALANMNALVLNRRQTIQALLHLVIDSISGYTRRRTIFTGTARNVHEKHRVSESLKRLLARSSFLERYRHIIQSNRSSVFLLHCAGRGGGSVLFMHGVRTMDNQFQNVTASKSSERTILRSLLHMTNRSELHKAKYLHFYSSSDSPSLAGRTSWQQAEATVMQTVLVWVLILSRYLAAPECNEQSPTPFYH